MMTKMTLGQDFDDDEDDEQRIYKCLLKNNASVRLNQLVGCVKFSCFFLGMLC